MSIYRITIEGDGPIDTADPRNGQVNAERVARRLLLDLRDNGHTISSATLAIDGTLDFPPSTIDLLDVAPITRDA